MTINTTRAKVLRRKARVEFAARKVVVECEVCGGRKRYKSPNNRCKACKYLMRIGTSLDKLRALLTGKRLTQPRKFRSRKFAQALPQKEYKSVFEVNHEKAG